MTCLALAAGAGRAPAANEGVHAQLSWSATSTVTDLTTIGSTSLLYVRLIDSVQSFRGGVLVLRWLPAGVSGGGCYEHLSTQFPVSPGTTCTFLNRGSAIPADTPVDTAGYFYVSWANTQALSSCTSGTIAQVTFALASCPSQTAGAFELCSLSIRDASNALTALPRSHLGARATVFGGAESLAPCNGRPFVQDVPDQFITNTSMLTVVPTAADPDGDPLTWIGDGLPVGAVVDSTTGVLTWTPHVLQAMVVSGVQLLVSDGFVGGTGVTPPFVISVSESSNVDGYTRGGAFRTQFSDSATGDLLQEAGVADLRSTWTYRDITPLLDAEYLDHADQAVRNAFAAGQQIAFTLVDADSLTADGRYYSRYPDDLPTWKSLVAALVERYDGDGIADMPGLPAPVRSWHLEEEDTFWNGTPPFEMDWANTYVAYFNAVADTIHVADASARVGLLGFSSNPLWCAAYEDGFVKVPDPDCPPTTALFRSRVQTLLQNAHYDFVDMHSYETSPIVQGTLRFLRASMPDTTRPILCFEAGGPFLARPAYTDTLNAYHAVYGASEALANGVTRYELAYIGAAAGSSFDGSDAFANVALVQRHPDGTSTPKPSYYTYRLLMDRLAGYTAASDLSPRTGPTEPDTLFHMRFDRPDGPVDVVWSDGAPRTTHITATTPSVRITHPVTAAGQTDADAAVEYRAVLGGVATIDHVTAEPLIIDGSDVLVGVASPPSAERPGVLVRPVPARSRVSFTWSGAPAHASLVVCDARGRVVHRQPLPAGARSGAVTWDTRTLPAGVYTATLSPPIPGRPPERFVILR